jgi:hypothetical protein
MVPVVQLKLLGVEAFKLRLAPVPLHIAAVGGLVMMGDGLTVIVIG